MKKFYLLLLLCCASIIGFGQVTALSPTGDGGFETGSAFSDNGWTSVNSFGNNWALGNSATPYGGSSRGAYITTGGSFAAGVTPAPLSQPYTYDITVASVSHLYKDIEIPAGASSISLTFQWKGKGQTGTDRMLVYTTTPDVMPIAGIPSSGSAMEGASLMWTQPAFTNSASYTLATVTLPASLAGTTARIVFTWQNDASGGVAPGAAIDNIGLTYCMVPAITGTTGICVGTTTALANSMTGGTWSTSSTAVTSVSASGVVTGLSAGTATIVYTVAGGCRATTVVTVNALPPANTGVANACVGAASTLANTLAGGTWSTSNPAIGTVDMMTGMVSGIAAGSMNVTYTSALGCNRLTAFTVKPLPAAIAGTKTVCVGATTTLTDPTTGGMSWTSAIPSVATISSSGGLVTGIASGTTTITYTLTSGCNTTAVVTVNPLPAAFSGSAFTCIGTSTTLSSADAGGTWSNSASTIASVGSATGIITGVSAGTSIITYTIATGCRRTVVATISALPAVIGGQAGICVGSTSALTNATAGGTWSSSDVSIAAIGTNGIVTGVATGNAVISYTIGSSCSRTVNVTVNAAVASPSFPSLLCTGVAYPLTTTATGGTWSSSNTGVASVSATGILNGVAAGNANITYAINAGCRNVTAVTIGQSPAAIGGANGVCEGFSTTLTNTVSGGTWSLSDATYATIDPSTGLVTGTTAGSITITYTLPSGCFKTKAFVVNPTPPAILGNSLICVGTGATLYSTILVGSSWTIANTSIATIGLSSGTLTGMGTGNTTATYTSSAGCYVTRVVTVDPAVAPITGTTVVCVGDTTTLSIAETGGYWSSANVGKAIVGSASGVVTGIGAGSVTLTYTIPSGCFKTTIVSVNPAPAAITGPGLTCVGTSITLATGSTGGAWSSSNTSVATISSTGVVNGISAGSINASYTLAGCSATYPVAINATVPAIGGATNGCVGAVTTLTNGATGGAWSSSNSTVATITSTGDLSGVAAGTANITYTITSTCKTSTTITVNAIPPAITGTASLCAGTAATLSNAVPGGVWSTSSTLITLGSATGAITAGSTAGTAVVSYTAGTGCSKSIIVTVNPLPEPITGMFSLCPGANTTLGHILYSGASWASSTPAVATINSSGVVTGITAGTTNITYAFGTGCKTFATVNVYPAAAAITGTASACEGAVATLANTGIGGAWSNSNAAVASIGSTGDVTGIAAGTTRVTYTTADGCSTSTVFTVNALPAPITGNAPSCQGSALVLGEPTIGGAWSSANTAIGTVSTSGVVMGTGTGIVTISYTMPTGCGRTADVTVNAAVAPITGTLTVCRGANTLLASLTAGGVWTSGNQPVAMVTSTGNVTAVSAGTATISYSSGSGCRSLAVVTVNEIPNNITGTTSVCAGSDVTLATTSTGGAWSSSNTAIGTISTAGVFSGIAAGSVSVSYAFATGCYKATTVLVNPLPSAISGNTLLCIGAPTVMTGDIGTSWTSSNTAVATIGSASGLVNPLSAGTTTITFSSNAYCIATTIVTVIPTPLPIAGGNHVCVGIPQTLTNGITGGTWTSSNTSKATIGFNTGIVNGIAVGTTSITYSLGSSCVVSSTITVDPVPDNITGTANVCVGLNTTLSDITVGGSWSSSNTSVASVGSLTGVVTGVSAGAATITYAFAGCYKTISFVVNPLPAAITGTLNVCTGFTTVLADATTGGAWTSGTPANASVVSGTGVVTGVAAGTSRITYTLPTGCITTTVVTANASPTAVTGPSSVCQGSDITLGSTPGAGTWSTSNGTVATVGLSTGIVSGVSAGNAVITYTINGLCIATKSVTVNQIVASTGNDQACVGTTSTLNNALAGGTWSSSNTGFATVGTSSGVVTGIAAGNINITYTFASGCTTATAFTVNPLPTAITGVMDVCEGATTNLASTPATGNWISGNPAKATVTGATGVVTGVQAGTASITYILPTGCVTTATVTIHATPAAITGTLAVCPTLTTTLANSVAGGVWSSASTANATIGSASGIVTGVAAGTAPISYTIDGLCAVGAVVTVNVTPAPIGGTLSVCEGLSTTLTNATGGGTWSSSSTANATIVAGTGVATGVLAGNSTITYRVTATGCINTAIVTVNISPNTSITGTPAVCVGLTTTYANSVAGGTWASSNTANATIDVSTGVITGVAAGTATITYAIGSCIATRDLTVNANPVAIGGTLTVCEGLTTTLTNATSGGTWSSSSMANATIGSASGTVTGVLAGNSTITYRLTATGCINTAIVTVNLSPNTSITGTPAVCVGLTTTYANSVAGGTWASSNTANATVDVSTGVITGVAAGTAKITYAIGSCIATRDVTVNANPVAIGATLSVCEGLTTTLTNATGGGTWSSSATANATIGSASGIVTGVAAGNTTITYRVTATGCINTAIVTVNLSPNTSITGTPAVCVGLTTTFANSVAGGTWASSNTANATVIAGTGVITGVAAGTAKITYAIGSCIATRDVTVNANPAAIGGTLSVCEAATTTLTNTTGGGTWSSSSAGNATIGSSSGTVTGVAAGNSTITYTVTATGCINTAIVTVNTAPNPAITGTSAACVGFTTTFANTIPGGTWSSSNTANATVDVNTGVITGQAAGTSRITYAIGSCNTTRIVTVNSNPTAIGGTLSACVAANSTLTSSAGGTWSSTNTAIGSIGSASGIVLGIAAGNTTISYVNSTTGCFALAEFTVNTTPAAITVATTTNVCVGQTITYTNSVPGGVWSSSNANATIGSATGVITGAVGSSTSFITYTIGSCFVTRGVSVVALPAAITGTASVCTGATTNLANATAGGTWSSSTPAVGTINASGTGVAGGITAGNTTITYTAAGGCFVTRELTVNQTPTAITGALSACTGLSLALASTPSGGTWISSSTGVATVGSSTGIVTGVSAGNSTVSYTLSTGCKVNAQVTVTASPAAIGANAVVCVGNTITLTDATAGGTWSSSNTSQATVGTSGAVTALSAGNPTYSYTLASGCFATATGTVNVAVQPITGTLAICANIPTTLTDATAGGTWTSSTPATGTIVQATGVFTGVNISGGTTTISYIVSAGCSTTAIATVNTSPAVIVGSVNACVGYMSRTYTDATVGGVWSSSNTAAATINASTGDLTGTGVGITVVSYTAFGCPAMLTVNVVASPTGLSNNSPVHPNSYIICANNTVQWAMLHAGGAGTSWTSSNSGIASINSTNGNVTGVSAGTALISFTALSTAAYCIATVIVTVNPTGALPAITGPSTVSTGANITLLNAYGGGAWTSSAPSNAAINGTTGIVTGGTPGPATITYTINYGGTCGSVSATFAIAATARPGHGADLSSTDAYGDVVLYPNPNGGLFTINGSIGEGKNEEVDMVITNVLGQVVYTEKVLTTDGKISKEVSLGNNTASGTYLLTLRYGGEHKVIRFTVK